MCNSPGRGVLGVSSGEASCSSLPGPGETPGPGCANRSTGLTLRCEIILLVVGKPV